MTTISTAIDSQPHGRGGIRRLRVPVALGLMAGIAAISIYGLVALHQPTRETVTATASQAHHAAAMPMAGMHMANAADQAGDRPQTILTPVSCQKLPDIPGKTMTTMIVDYPPNAYTPRHRHPGNVTAIVLKGSIRSQLLGGPSIVYSKGKSWFEPPGAIHLFAENASQTESAQMLAIFVADDDCGRLVIPDLGD